MSNSIMMEPKMTVQQAASEASRCLFCYDAPCNKGCPAGIDVAGFIRRIKYNDFVGAFRKIEEENPLGGVCARVCPVEKLCEMNCSYIKIDRPINIAALQGFAVEEGCNRRIETEGFAIPERKEKIAVIGFGPSGISCAVYLSSKGYRVTVFEKEKKPGGIITYVISPYKLDYITIKQDVDNSLFKNQINIKYGKSIDSIDSIKKLLYHNYKAVYLSIGMQDPAKIGIDGENLNGVLFALDFLRDIKEKNKENEIKKKIISKSVVVIGGGNVAMDSAEAAIKIGAKSVDLICLEGFKEMPAFRKEIEKVLKERVRFHNRVKPLRIIGDKRKNVTGVECISIRWKKPNFFVPSNAIEIPETNFRLNADIVIEAIGQKMDDSALKIISKMERTKNGLLKINKNTMMTSVEGIFAGGDIVRGGGTVVEAVASGKKAAKSIIKYLEQKRRE